MISFIVRCIITFALLDCLQYSTDFTHVDVRDPYPCLSLIGEAQAQPDNACVYHDVTLHGDPLARRFWIGKPGGPQVESHEATVQFSPTKQSGWTWRTCLFLIGAVLPWLLSLVDGLIRIGERTSPAPPRRS